MNQTFPHFAEALAYHVIRSEMRNTAVVDFKGLRIQYQGDRMQVLAYLPLDDEQEAAVRAVRVAAALNHPRLEAR